MEIKTEELLRLMMSAADKKLGKKLKKNREIVEGQFAKLAQAVTEIEASLAAGKIDKDDAQIHLRINRRSAEMVLLQAQGLSLLAVEEAVNAALDAVRGCVNATVKFPLI